MACPSKPPDQFSDLRDRLLAWGATVVSYGDVGRGLARELKHLPRDISRASAHPPRGGSLGLDGEEAYCHAVSEVDAALDRIQRHVVRLLKAGGRKAMAIPPDTHRSDSRFIARLYPLFPHKTAATCAGLGWIGKSGLLINPLYGPRMSWATVLTDAPLEVCLTPYKTGRCGGCRRCVEACPVGAIPDREWSCTGANDYQIDTVACAGHLLENKKKTGQAVCGQCVMACPYAQKVRC